MSFFIIHGARFLNASPHYYGREIVKVKKAEVT